MSFRHLPRVTLILATLAVLPLGCGEEVKVKQVPASEVTPSKTAGRLTREVQPAKGSSAGMRYNPGGPPPGADVD